MSTELIINASLPEVRVALLQDQEIIEVLIERSELKGIVGNIYKGRVTRVLPGMQAAFVDIGLEKAAFLYVDDVYHHPMAAIENESMEGENENFEERAENESSEPGLAVAEGEMGASEEGPVTSEADAHEFIRDMEAPQSEGELPAASESAEEGAVQSASSGNDLEDETASESAGEDFNPEGETVKEAAGESEEPANESAEVASSESDALEGAEEGGKIQAPGRSGSREKRGFKGRRGQRGRKGAYLRPKQSIRPVGSAQEDLVPPALAYAAEQTTETHPGAERFEGVGNRPDSQPQQQLNTAIVKSQPTRKREFKMQRGSDRRIPTKGMRRSFRPVQIQDLLKEGQEVLVQIAKDPIATKGARLTCHISLPGRHLVCMPTIDHVGVSRRIERDDERRRLRDFVERNRPKGVGFIVRTASGKHQSAEKRIKQDIDYLTELWNEIREKAAAQSAPSLIYEDLNAILKPIRDWVTEDVDKIIVDSRYHHGEIIRFVSKFMPALRSKVELYHGDIPVFDAYNISTELSRALERKVWLKSGGYIVIDQAEALVAIDVNTGRYVGKRNLEDTILKTNLEAVKEIAYQLRLRNCGGIIILDFIDMEKEENRQRVYRALDEELKKDRSRPTIQKISDLGLVEMTRKRTVDTMIRVLGETCAHCEGRGFVKSKITVAYEILRDLEREGLERDVDKLLIQAHPDVIEKLAIDEKETLDALERRYGKVIFLQGVEGFHPEQFEISSDKKERKAREYERSRDEKLSQRKEVMPKESGEGDSDLAGDEGGMDLAVGGDESAAERDSGSSGQSGAREPRRGREGRFDRKNRNHRRDRGGQRGSGNFGQRSDSPARIQPRTEAVRSVSPNDPSEVPGGGEPGNAEGYTGNENTALFAEGLVVPEQQTFDPQDPRAGGPGAGDRPIGEDDFSEEDRLAFLRAQAAQDAAIANLGAGNNAVISRGGRHSGGGRFGGDAGGRSADRSGRSGGRNGGKGGKNKGRNRTGHHAGHKGKSFQGAGQNGGQGRGSWTPGPGGSQPGVITPRERTPEQAAAFSYREEARAAIEGIQKDSVSTAEVQTKDSSDFQD